MSVRHSEALALARAHRMNRKTVRNIFFNKLEKVVTENNLSDTPGNIFNIDESGIQIKKKPDSAITD
jgi:hypothetical protein